MGFKWPSISLHVLGRLLSGCPIFSVCYCSSNVIAFCTRGLKQYIFRVRVVFQRKAKRMPDECTAKARIFLESESCYIIGSFVNKYTKIGI